MEKQKKEEEERFRYEYVLKVLCFRRKQSGRIMMVHALINNGSDTLEISQKELSRREHE